MMPHRSAFKLVRLLSATILGLSLVGLLLIFYGSITPPVSAAPLQTAVSGTISTDTTWNQAGSPYTVTGLVNVQAQLTISPGVEIRFLSGAGLEFTNGGSLQAIGSASQPITFTSDAATPARGDWEHISFADNVPDSSIQYAVIEYATNGLDLGSNTVFTILSNTLRYNGNSSFEASISGSPDNSTIQYNTIYSSTNGLYINEVGSSTIADNLVYDTDYDCINISSPGTASSNNIIQDNQLHTCADDGFYMDGGSGTTGTTNQILNNQIWNTGAEGIQIIKQFELTIQGNTVYSTALTDTAPLGAVVINNVDFAAIQDNYFFDNGNAGGSYVGTLYIQNYSFASGASSNLTITGNRIEDSVGSGLVFADDNDIASPQTINSNAICTTGPYEIENDSDNAFSLLAEGNWLSTNFPVAGTEITGTVDITPFIELSAGASPLYLPADGVSAAAITAAMTDGAGHTVPDVPPGGRDLDLTTSLGSLSASSFTMDGSGQAGGVGLTSTTPGTAIITVTEWCGYAVTATVEFTSTDLILTKSTPLTQVIPGDTITYTLAYTNGVVTATNVVITDDLPTGTVWVTDTAEISGFTRLQTSPTVAWNLGDLPANAEGTISVVAQLPTTATTQCGQTLLNTAVITSATSELDPNNNTATDSSISVICADVTISKAAPPNPLVPGQLITYTLTYTNNGTAPASGIVITDVSPITGGIITLASGLSLAPGASGTPLEYAVTVPTAACTTGLLTNTAFISTDTPESDSGNNSDTVTNSVFCAELAITKTLTSLAPSLGKVTTFTVEYANTGVYTAPNAVITDFLHPNFEYVTDTLGLAPLTSTTTVRWNLGDVGPGQSGSFEVGLQSLACGSGFTNTVQILSDLPEQNMADNISTAGPFDISCAVDMVIVKNDGVGPPQDLFVWAGDLITYTISYNNIGGTTATGVVITETLPDYTQFLPARNPGWSGGPITYTYNVGDVPAGGGGVLQFIVKVDPALPLTVTVVNNRVEIDSAEADADDSDNVSYEQTPVQAAPDLFIEKIGLDPVVHPGDQVTYVITITNQGSVSATNTLVTDTLPTGTSYVTNTVYGPPTGTTWNIGTVQPGQSASFALTVLADAGICSDTYLINTVETRSEVPEGDYTNNITSTLPAESPIIACEDLVITKTLSAASLSLGKPFTFTISYENAGIVPMTNVVINDLLDPNTRYVGDTRGGAITSTGVVTWNLGNIPAGMTGSFDVAILANVCSDTGETFTNTATITSTVPEPYLPNNISQAVATLPSCSAVDMVVLKNDGVGGTTERPFVWAGDLITYTISYNNIGGANATGVVLTETVPTHTTFIGPVTGNGWFSAGGSLYTYNVGDVASMGGGVLDFVVRVDPDLPAGVDFVYNQVDIGSNETDVDPTDNTSYEQTPVQAAPNLYVEKSGPATARPGDQITYVITVTNQGVVSATNVVITDTLPPIGTSYITDTSGIAPGFSGLNPIWNIGTLNSGQTFTFNLTIDTSTASCATPVLTNTVEAYPTGQQDADAADNIATAATALICHDVAISKTVNTPTTTPDQDVVFTLTYSNPGAFQADNVVITDTLPAGITFVSSNPAASGPVGDEYSWSFASLSAGISNTIVLTGHVDAGVTCDTPLTNTAGITTTSTDQDAANNIATATVSVICAPDLGIFKNDRVGGPTERPFVQPGDVITYSISYNNIGTDPASNGVITETLPNFTSFVGPTGPAGWQQVGSSREYTYSLGTVGAGMGGVVLFAVQVQSGPTSGSFITNTVCIGTSDADANSNNDCSHEQTLVQLTAPRLSVNKSAQPPSGSNVAVGEIITYTITVLNDGQADAANVVITDTLPLTEVSFITATLSNGSPVSGPNPLTANIGPLTQNSAVTMTVVVSVNNVADGTVITNTAQASADTLTVQSSLPVTHVVGLTTTGELTAVKLAAPPSGTPVDPGDTITYTIVLHSGSNALTNVVLTDTIPANTAYVAGSAGHTPVIGVMSADSSRVRLDIASFPANSTVTATFAVTVATNFTTTISNQAEFISDQTTLTTTNVVTHPVRGTEVQAVYLPIIIKDYPPIPPTPTPVPTTPPTPTPTPTPLAYVSDVKADPDSNQVFIASPRHDAVYVIDGSVDDVDRSVAVAHGPTGLTVLESTSNRVFVAHQYAANLWDPGVKIFGVNDATSYNPADDGYVGAAPIKIASNGANNRVYVSNYFDKLAVLDGNSETRLGWVEQKAYQAAYGIDVSRATNRVYLATRDTGELIVFDGNSDRLLQSGYIPTHVKPPQACTLWSVAVNESTGHVFVPCPQLSKVYVLQESQVTVLDLEALGVLEERDGYKALVVSPQAAPWIAEIDVPIGTGLGEEGIAVVDEADGYVFITNATTDEVVVLQDGATPAYVTTISAVGTKPQGIDVNPVTGKFYVGNATSNNVTVFSATSPFTHLKTILLTP